MALLPKHIHSKVPRVTVALVLETEVHAHDKVVGGEDETSTLSGRELPKTLDPTKTNFLRREKTSSNVKVF